MAESFELKAIFNAKPSEIYAAWLNSDEHSKMTGGRAECSEKIGEPFTSWDGYITGKNLELKPNQTIVQSWRTSEFAETDTDSKLTIQLEALENGTALTLTHSNIPADQSQYEQGWLEHYFEPMQLYFK